MCFHRRGVLLIAARYARRTTWLSLGEASAKISTTVAVPGVSSLNAVASALAAALWPSPYAAVRIRMRGCISDEHRGDADRRPHHARNFLKVALETGDDPLPRLGLDGSPTSQPQASPKRRLGR